MNPHFELNAGLGIHCRIRNSFNPKNASNPSNGALWRSRNDRFRLWRLQREDPTSPFCPRMHAWGKLITHTIHLILPKKGGGKNLFYQWNHRRIQLSGSTRQLRWGRRRMAWQLIGVVVTSRSWHRISYLDVCFSMSKKSQICGVCVCESFSGSGTG